MDLEIFSPRASSKVTVHHHLAMLHHQPTKDMVKEPALSTTMSQRQVRRSLSNMVRRLPPNNFMDSSTWET